MMLDYVREGDTVYVKDLSRLARNTKDLLDIVEYLNNKGVGLFSIKENIDTSTNFGKLMITFLAAIYEFERVNLLERQRDGSRSGVNGNGEFSATQLNDGDVGTQALPSTTGAEENANG